MTDQELEQEIQAKSLTAPLITPDDIEANIASEHYFTAAEGYAGNIARKIEKHEPINVTTQEFLETFDGPLSLLTFCVLTFRNGFTVTGECAFASPKNFNAELGRKIARQNAIDKVWLCPERKRGEIMMTDLRCDIATDAGRALTSIAHDLAYRAGWWTHLPSGTDLRELVREPKDEMQKLLANALVAQKLALVHSELSEALEGHRKGLMDDKLPHLTMLEVELADAVIRISDLAGALKLDLGSAIAEKLAYNANRPDHKPENRLAEGGKSY